MQLEAVVVLFLQVVHPFLASAVGRLEAVLQILVDELVVAVQQTAVAVHPSVEVVGLPFVGVDQQTAAVGLPLVGVDQQIAAVGLPFVGVDQQTAAVGLQIVWEPVDLALAAVAAWAVLPFAVAVQQTPAASVDPCTVVVVDTDIVVGILLAHLERIVELQVDRERYHAWVHH